MSKRQSRPGNPVQAAVYLRAAADIAEKNDYSCNLVQVIGGTPARHLYETVMGTRGSLFIHHISIGADHGDLHMAALNTECDNCRDFRVLLLCMMAACCKDVQ